MGYVPKWDEYGWHVFVKGNWNGADWCAKCDCLHSDHLPMHNGAKGSPTEDSDQNPEDGIGTKGADTKGLAGVVISPDSKQNGDHIDHPKEYS